MREITGLKTYAIWFILLMFIPLLGHRKVLTAQRQAVAEFGEKNAGLEKILSERTAILEDLRNRRSAAESAAELSASYSRSFISAALVPDILDGLARLAESSGIALSGATHSKMKAELPGFPAAVDIDLSFAGSLTGMKRFVRAMDSLEVPVKVMAVKAVETMEGTTGTISCRVLTGGM